MTNRVIASGRAQNPVYNAQRASITINGAPVQDVESFGFDQGKDHELQHTVDRRAVWVISTPELSGSCVVKATSDTAARLQRMFEQNVNFGITARLGPTAGLRRLNFVRCMMTGYNHSDVEVDGLPTLTMEWTGLNTGPVAGGGN